MVSKESKEQHRLTQCIKNRAYDESYVIFCAKICTLIPKKFKLSTSGGTQSIHRFLFTDIILNENTLIILIFKFYETVMNFKIFGSIVNLFQNLFMAHLSLFRFESLLLLEKSIHPFEVKSISSEPEESWLKSAFSNSFFLLFK